MAEVETDLFGLCSKYAFTKLFEYSYYQKGKQRHTSLNVGHIQDKEYDKYKEI